MGLNPLDSRPTQIETNATISPPPAIPSVYFTWPFQGSCHVLNIAMSRAELSPIWQEGSQYRGAHALPTAHGIVKNSGSGLPPAATAVASASILEGPSQFQPQNNLILTQT